MARQRDYQPSIDRLRAKCEVTERQLAKMSQKQSAARREADWCRAEIQRLNAYIDDLEAQARLQDIVLADVRADRDAAERALDTCGEMLRLETLARQAAERRAAAARPSLRERMGAALQSLRGAA
jgi:hypothetical protein